MRGAISGRADTPQHLPAERRHAAAGRGKRPDPPPPARRRSYASDTDIYSKLAKSIAPEIYGHEDVKKARGRLRSPCRKRLPPTPLLPRGEPRRARLPTLAHILPPPTHHRRR